MKVLKRHDFTRITLIVFTMATASARAERAVTIVDVKGHNEQPNVTGVIEDTFTGEEMDKPVPGLPSSWRAVANDYPNEWQCTGGVLDTNTSINGKVGWIVWDLGSSHVLSNLYVWSLRQTGDAYVEDYNVYVAVTPTVSVPDGPTGTGTVDYDFASGGWTKVNSSVLTLPRAGSIPDPAQAIVSLGGVTARWVAIEAITWGGSSTRLGLAEVGITEVDVTPPTLTSTNIVDDRGGASIEANQFVTYTITFDEDMDAETISTSDVDNAGSAAMSIYALSNNTPTAQVWTVVVQPSTGGTLQLRVPTGASLADISGNVLGGLPILDDTTITVTLDETDPTIASTNIVDDRVGAPVPVGDLVTYTITFSEDIDHTTVSSADFGNAGSSSISFGAISETSAGVFSIPVTPTTEGTLQLQINASAVIEDIAGNTVDTTSAIMDDTVITADGTDPTLVPGDIVDDKSGDGVRTYALVTYTVTFSEDMDDTTVTSSDFGNAGSAGITIGNVAETAPGIFAVQFQPTTTGSLQLQVNASAVIEDVAGNTVNTASPIIDNTTLAVSAARTNSITLAPILDITAQHQGQSADPGAGSITTAIDGSGITKGDPLDPSTWTQSNGWQQEWAAKNGLLNPSTSTNGKIGWLVFDLGDTTSLLQDLYLWNYQSGTTMGIKDYNIYVATSPTITPPAPTGTATDYDFASGGWTQFNPAIPMLLPIRSSTAPEQIVNLAGISARYIAMEIITNHGHTTWVGLSEIGLTYQLPPAGLIISIR